MRCGNAGERMGQRYAEGDRRRPGRLPCRGLVPLNLSSRPFGWLASGEKTDEIASHRMDVVRTGSDRPVCRALDSGSHAGCDPSAA
jgi:hypothetical protein